MTPQEARLVAESIPDYEWTRAQLVEWSKDSGRPPKSLVAAIELIDPLDYAKARRDGSTRMESVIAGLQAFGRGLVEAFTDCVRYQGTPFS